MIDYGKLNLVHRQAKAIGLDDSKKRSVTKIAGQTETQPMSKTNVGANLMFAKKE